jgi:lipopolysaccharide transport system permease protein
MTVTSTPATTESRPAPARSAVRNTRRGYAFDVSTHLFARDFRSKYRRAFFGWIWSVGQPLIRYLVFAFVFTNIYPTKIKDFPAFLFAGLIFWTWFSSAILSATSSFLVRRDLLFRPGLPRWTLPLTNVLSEGLDLLAALPVLFAILAITGTPIRLPVVTLPLLILLIGLYAWAIGMLLAAANIFYRDVRLVLEVVLVLGMYATPVVYRIDRVPAQYRTLVKLNPMTGILNAVHAVLLDGEWPNFGSLAITAGVALVLVILALAVFERASQNFVDMV